MSTWMEEAYELGQKVSQKDRPTGYSRRVLRLILDDPTPNNWVKWWRRGFLDAEKVRRLTSCTP